MFTPQIFKLEGETIVSYKKATEVIPDELLKELQHYINGEYIYIPKTEATKAEWGANTESKTMVKRRNTEIYQKYLSGTPTKELANLYFLSQKTIQKIIANVKKE